MRGKKRFPQRQLNMIDGIINSQCEILNFEERRKFICQANDSAVMADLKNQKIKEKEQKRKHKVAKDIARAPKRKRKKKKKWKRHKKQ